MDLARLRTHFRADCLVSLKEPVEYAALGLSDFGACAVANGTRPEFFPIADMHPPHERDRNAFIHLVKGIVSAAGAGQSVVIHCRAGFGRSGLVAASVLVARGLSAAGAIDLFRAVRSPLAVETAERRAWVRSLEGALGPEAMRGEAM
ncbi:MAG: tyrosine protein phosphatase [Chloroflexi bacterium]|nr:tyrosine protein phosphatase [Chloroflexota bacterium]